MAITYGLDLTSLTSYAWDTDYSGYFDSPLYLVGTPTALRSFNRADIQLAKALGSGEGIKVEYRKASTGSWTTAFTFDYATYGALQSKSFDTNIRDCEFIQFRVSLLGSSSGTPQFRSLTIQ